MQKIGHIKQKGVGVEKGTVNKLIKRLVRLGFLIGAYFVLGHFYSSKIIWTIAAATILFEYSIIEGIRVGIEEAEL